MQKSVDFQDLSKYTPEGQREVENVCRELDEIVETLGPERVQMLHTIWNNYAHEMWLAINGIASGRSGRRDRSQGDQPTAEFEHPESGVDTPEEFRRS